MILGLDSRDGAVVVDWSVLLMRGLGEVQFDGKFRCKLPGPRCMLRASIQLTSRAKTGAETAPDLHLQCSPKGLVPHP